MIIHTNKNDSNIHNKTINIFLPHLIKTTLESIMSAELTYHLGYNRHAVAGRLSGNSRNGYSPKKINTPFGKIQLRIPRDRMGTFSAKVLSKYKRSIQIETELLLNAFSFRSVRFDLERLVQSLFSTELDSTLLDLSINALEKNIKKWQNKRLLSQYTELSFLDVENKHCAVVALRPDGSTELVGVWKTQVLDFDKCKKIYNELQTLGISQCKHLSSNSTLMDSHTLNRLVNQDRVIDRVGSVYPQLISFHGMQAFS